MSKLESSKSTNQRKQGSNISSSSNSPSKSILLKKSSTKISNTKVYLFVPNLIGKIIVFLHDSWNCSHNFVFDD